MHDTGGMTSSSDTSSHSSHTSHTSHSPSWDSASPQYLSRNPGDLAFSYHNGASAGQGARAERSGISAAAALIICMQVIVPIVILVIVFISI